MGLFLTQYANGGKSCGADVYSYKRNPFADTVETSEESESIPALARAPHPLLFPKWGPWWRECEWEWLLEVISEHRRSPQMHWVWAFGGVFSLFWHLGERTRSSSHVPIVCHKIIADRSRLKRKYFTPKILCHSWNNQCLFCIIFHAIIMIPLHCQCIKLHPCPRIHENDWIIHFNKSKQSFIR